MIAPVPPFWQLFSGLQLQANASILNSRAWGTEEALNTLLSEIPQDDGTYVPQIVLNRFTNLSGNRAAKHRQRQQILYEKQRDLEDWVSKPSDPSHIAIQREQLERLQTQSTPEEWYLLEALAAGYTYQELAEYQGISVSSFKTQVFRLRKRLVRGSNA